MPWEAATIDSNILAIHAAVLPNNKILYFGGSEHNPVQNESGNVDDLDNTRLFNVADGTVTKIASPTTDVFCSGHAFLSDGRLLVGGGTEQWGTGLGGDPNHPLYWLIELIHTQNTQKLIPLISIELSWLIELIHTQNMLN